MRPMIRIEHLTKRYGATTALDDVTFDAQPGLVTGFLGPNGSGKSTTMRIVLGLDAATSGRALVNGRRHAELRAPLREIGAMLDAQTAHPGRKARHHLQWLARSNGIPLSCVDKALGLVGIQAAAESRVGTFSLGMSQRLGIAAALLGDPRVLMLDEPINGLDAEGIRWLRSLLGDLASQGRTVLVSSHVMSEMQLVADRLVIIGEGRVLADVDLADLEAQYAPATVVVHAVPRDTALAVLERLAKEVHPDADGTFLVRGADPTEIGPALFAAGATALGLHELRPSLEEIYVGLTSTSVVHRAEAVSPSQREITA